MPLPRAAARLLQPSAARIALLYIVVALAWIWWSDDVLAAVAREPGLLTRIQSVKGTGFVLASGLGLYVLMRIADARVLRERGIAEAAIADVSEAVFVTGRDDTFILVNGAAATLTGSDQHSLLGRSSRELFAAATVEQIGARHARVLSTGRAEETEELWVPLRLGGTPRLVRATTSALSDPSGRETRPVGIVCLARDVTAERQAEAALRLREAALRDGEKLEALGRLAGGVAHDFNNLLTVIRGNAQLLTEAIARGEAPTDEMREVIRAADRAAELTRGLLAFSRHRPSPRETVDVDGAVRDIAALLRRAVPASVQLAVLPAGDAGLVAADAAAVTQLVMNLVLNAADAVAAVDGGTVTVETSATDHSMTSARGASDVDLPPGRYAIIRVIDTGVGMDDVTRRRATEPFFTTKGPGRGTGLGLATAVAVAHQHAGTLVIDSVPGAGTTVTVYLPQIARPALVADAVPPDTDDRVAGSRDAPASASPQRVVLLVEDESAVRALARRVLQNAGYLVYEARHGADALRIADGLADAPALVVTDVVMPELGGVSLVQHLRERWPALPALFVSGYTDGEIVSVGPGQSTPDGTMIAPSVLLEKPFTADALVAQVGALLATGEAVA